MSYALSPPEFSSQPIVELVRYWPTASHNQTQRRIPLQSESAAHLRWSEIAVTVVLTSLGLTACVLATVLERRSKSRRS